MRKIIDYTISKEDLSDLPGNELSKLFMYTDRDRKDADKAEEINRRIEYEKGN